MKRFVSRFFVCFLLIAAVCAGNLCFANFNAQTEVTSKLYSKAYYMVSLDDGTEMFSKNAEHKTHAAAFTKLLGAIVAIESWGNLDGRVEITEEALSLIKYDYGVRTAGLKVGESYTKRQMIEALMVYSANDCASVIAHEISGSAEAFVAQMNALAQKIGCTESKFVNIHGFDADGQYTTAHDIARIIQYGLNSPVFAEAFRANSITLPATEKNNSRTLNSDNRMTSSVTPDYYHGAVNGGKYTSTTKAGECIAVTSSQDGYSYLTVVMRGDYRDVDKDGVKENTCMTDAKQMLTWVYGNIRFRVIATENQTVSVVNIIAGRNSDTLRLVPEKETSALVPAKASSNSVLITPIEESLPPRLTAPVKAGQVICQAKVFYADQEITTINLVAADDVGLSLFRLFMTKLSRLLSSTAFILIEIAALLVVLTYLGLLLYGYWKHKKPVLRKVPDSGKKNGEKR